MKFAAGVLVLAAVTIVVDVAGAWTESLWGRIASLAAVGSIIALAVIGLVRYMWVPGEGIHTYKAGSVTDWHNIAPGHEDKAKDP